MLNSIGSVFSILFVILPANSSYLPNRTFFRTTNDKVNYENALEQCEGFGDNWSLPNYQIFQEDLHRYMRFHQFEIKSAWLGVKKKSLPFWTWINNVSDPTIMAESDIPGSHSSLPCAALDVSVQSLTPISCGHQGVGFICQMPIGKMCPEEFHRHSCFRKADVWYIIACNSKNWYHARSYCVKKGGDLAVLNTPKKRSDIVNAIINRRLAGECSSVFIGLKKENWLLTRAWSDTQSSNVTESYTVKHMRWTTDEPRPKHDCVKLSVDAKHYGWTTDDCFNPNPVICQNYGEGILQTVPMKATKNYQKGGTEWIVATVAATILGAIIFVFVLVVLITRYAIRIRNKNRIRISLEENHPLLPRTLASFNGITVVIFSEGINKESKKLQGVKIIHKNVQKHKAEKDSGTRTAICIVNGFKKVLDEEISDNKLRIVNMDPLVGRKLPDLVKVAPANVLRDVIYVPEITAPTSKEFLKCLSELRKKYVCITAAKRECNEGSAAECIAVGVKPYTDTMITSGVLDIVLDATECEDCHSLEDGTAVAVGIIAGMLHNLKDLPIMRHDTMAEFPRTRLIRHVLIQLVGNENLEDHTLTGYGLLSCKKIVKPEDKMEKILDKMSSLDNIKKENTQVKEEESSNSSGNTVGDATVRTESNLGINKIKIVVAATPICKESNFSKDLEIVPYKRQLDHMTDPTNDEGVTNAIKEFIKELRNFEVDLKRVKIYEAPVYPEKNLPDWYYWRNGLQDNLPGNGDTPHVIFIAAIKRIPPAAMRIQHTVRALKRKSIVITNAIGLKGPGGPTAFPSGSAIAVSHSDNEPCGSTVDYLVPSDESLKSAMKAVAIATTVLVKAQDLGIQGEHFTKLCQTNIMHSILREMCKHPSEHIPDEGFGKLDPSSAFEDDQKLELIINKYLHVTPDTVTDIWSGKNI